MISKTRDAGQSTTLDGRPRVIAIDGPAAAGKTTVARLLAKRIDGIFLDTGMLYRAVTVASGRAGLSPSDGAALTAFAGGLDIQIRPPSVEDGRASDVLVDGEDVTSSLRTAAVDAVVSEIAAHPGVRSVLLRVQREAAETGRVVMVGRDIATVVVPDASVKIYLDASLRERARRRSDEHGDDGGGSAFDAVLTDLARRDEADSSRADSPLRRAADAIVIDSDGKSVAEIVETIARIAESTWGTA